jgi:hypothetical protein
LLFLKPYYSWKYYVQHFLKKYVYPWKVVKIRFLLHRFFIKFYLALDLNFLVVSTQKSKVRFYLGQTLSPQNVILLPSPNPAAALTPPTAPPKQGQNYPWTESCLFPFIPSIPQPLFICPTSALAPAGTGMGGGEYLGSEYEHHYRCQNN